MIDWLRHFQLQRLYYLCTRQSESGDILRGNFGLVKAEIRWKGYTLHIYRYVFCMYFV